jgi:phosphoserine phosphatase
MSATFRTVVLDVDSTVAGIEGIDWLAERRGPDIAAEIARLTDEAMRGLVPLEGVYGARLDAIRPTRGDIDALSRAYVATIAPGCEDVVRRLIANGVRVVLVSGGLKPAIEPLAQLLGVVPAELHAVDIRFDARGEYLDFDRASPLATSAGKPIVVARLDAPRPILAVGDGATDVAMRPAVDTFAAYTGFARRPNVVAQADVVLDSFAELATLVLGS